MSKRIIRSWMNLEVKEILEENHDTKTLIMVNQESGDCAFDYVAGQYLTFRFDGLAEKPIVRSYTMSSSPKELSAIAVTVKEIENGFVSRHLCKDVSVGTVLKARGAIGRFCYDPKQDNKHLIMVAAGSGVTPFVSIMKEYEDRLGEADAPERMTLIVSFRSRKDLICWGTLERLREKTGIRVLVTLSRDSWDLPDVVTGRITSALLEQTLAGQYSNATFMTCGPDEMMKMTAEHVFAKGVEKEHMKLESFSS